jgi:hypothetical protein
MKHLEGALGCFGFLNIPAVRAQDFAYEVAYRRLVVNHQSFNLFRHGEEYSTPIVAL